VQSPTSSIHDRVSRRCPWVALGLMTLFAVAAPAGSRAERSNDRLSVIGCIKRSPADVSISPGVTAILSGQTQYVLSNITLSGRDAAASPSAVIAQAVNTYRLDDAAGATLAPHVGERVEVTGVLAREPERPIGTTGRAESEGDATKSPLLKIESLRTISVDAESCRQ
jgi:hypothetical protein